MQVLLGAENRLLLNCPCDDPLSGSEEQSVKYSYHKDDRWAQKFLIRPGRFGMILM
jgi:hypothetical protein